MSQLVRAIAWRGGQAFTLFLLGTVVVAGCFVAARFSELTDTPSGSVGVLLLLGVVALSTQAAATARTRRGEIALAQIRGRHGPRLFGYFLVEPVTILVLAAAAGVLLGRFVTTVAANRWLASPDDPGHLSGLVWFAVAVALVGSIGAVIAGSWRTLRQPLIEQLDAGHRPRPAVTLVLFGQTLVIVAAVIAAYQATQHAGSRDGWAGIVNPALLSPILLGLAAGQVAAWTLRGVASLSARRNADPRRVGTFLAVRRLARRSDTVIGARLVIAAAVVATVTASATSAVAAWQDESTRLALGGPEQFSVDGGGLAAYEVSHQADPDGHWLMAMVAAPDDSLAYRRVFVDAARWDAVVGDFFGGTGAASVSRHLAMLDRGKPVIPAVGDKVTVSFDNAALQHVGGPTVTIYYAPAGSSVTTVILAPGRPTSGHGDTTVSARLPGCRRGCTVTQLVVDGWARHAAGQPRYLVLTGIDFAGQQLLDQTTWSVPKGDSLHSTVRQRGGSLYVLMTVWGLDNLKPAEATQRLAAVTTPGFSPDRDAGSDVGYAVDGSQHPVQVVGRADLLPFVGRRGMLMDLPRGLAGGSSTIPTAQSVVVARADTPESVIDRLTQSGAVGGERQFQTSLDHARERADAQGVRLYVLMSVFAGLIAAVGLAASVSGQREQRRREAASLRVTGVRSGQVGAANRTEAGWLAVCAFVVVAVAGWVAARITLAGLALVPQTAYSPPLEGTPDLVGLLAVAATAGLLIWVVTMWFARGIARHSPPSLLRDEVDR